MKGGSATRGAVRLASLGERIPASCTGMSVLVARRPHHRTAAVLLIAHDQRRPSAHVLDGVGEGFGAVEVDLGAVRKFYAQHDGHTTARIASARARNVRASPYGGDPNTGAGLRRAQGRTLT